ncbi:MAG: hypothetical protein KGH71_01905 [Candidatus Micrarchaeota archaeon]|nr:hypothetical protein [Candidatus Micrarchaeota archaeon]
MANTMLLTAKSDLAPSLMTQKISRIHELINNYHKSSSKILSSEIRDLKYDFHAAGPWVRLSKEDSAVKKELNLLFYAMNGLDLVSKSLDDEGNYPLSETLESIQAHHKLHEGVEEVKRRLLSNHEDPNAFSVAIEAAAMIAENPDYRAIVMTSIYEASLRGGPATLVFREIQRRI